MLTRRPWFLALLLFALSIDATGAESDSPSPLCPTTPDLLTISGNAAAGNGSGFLLLGLAYAQPLDLAYAQPLDVDGLPAAEARRIEALAQNVDLDWAGDRYIAVSGNELVAFAADGAQLPTRSRLPLQDPKAGWNGSRGLLLGHAPDDPNALWASPVSNDGTFGTPIYLGDSHSRNYAVEPFGDGFLAVYILQDLNLVAALRFDSSGVPVGDVRIVAAVIDAEDVRIAVHAQGALIAFRSYLDLLTVVPMDLDGTIGAPGFSIDYVRYRDYLLAPTPAGGLLYVNRLLGGPEANLLISLDAEARSTRRVPAGVMAGGILVPRDSRGFLFVKNGTTTPLDFDGNPVGSAHAAVLAPANQEEVKVASDGARFVSAWITRTAVGDRVEAVALTAGSRDRTCYSVHQSTARVDGLALAGSPAGFLAVWAEEKEVRAALLAGDSWIPVDTGLTLSRAGLAADLTWADGTFHLAWMDACDFAKRPYACSLRTARISPGGVVSDAESIPTAYLPNPRVAGNPLVVAATEITETSAASPYYMRAVVIGTSPTGQPVVHEVLPSLLVNDRAPLEPSIDIASNGNSTVVVLTDRSTVETIVLGPDGSPARRTAIARGNPVYKVAIAPSSSGFVATWVSQLWPPGATRFALFTAPLSDQGSLDGAIRWTELPQLDYFGLIRFDLDIATASGESLVTFIAQESSDPTRLDSLRAHGSFASDMSVHPGAPAAPASATLRGLGDHLWEVRWTPVPGATAYLVQSLHRPNPWPFNDRPYWTNYRLVSGDESVATWFSGEAPVRARVYAITVGLLSEPLIVEFPRHRVVAR